MKSQGAIRAEVSLSLPFTSVGDDIQEIYMGSGMIINEKEKELCLGRREPWAVQQSKDSLAMWKFIQGTEISAGHLVGDAPQ